MTRQRPVGIVHSEINLDYKKQPVVCSNYWCGWSKSGTEKMASIWWCQCNFVWIMSLASYGSNAVWREQTSSDMMKRFIYLKSSVIINIFWKQNLWYFWTNTIYLRKKLAITPFTKYALDFWWKQSTRSRCGCWVYVRNLHEKIFTEKDNKERTLFFHVTCATDNNQIEQVIATVKFSWLKTVLEASGMM